MAYTLHIVSNTVTVKTTSEPVSLERDSSVYWRCSAKRRSLLAKLQQKRTQVPDGDVVTGSVDVSPVDVGDSFTIADHVATYHTTLLRRQPRHHHRVRERSSAHVRRLARQ